MKDYPGLEIPFEGMEEISRTLNASNVTTKIIRSKDKKVGYYLGWSKGGMASILRVEHSEEGIRLYKIGAVINGHPKGDEILGDIIKIYDKLVSGSENTLVMKGMAREFVAPEFVAELEKILFEEYGLKELMKKERKLRIDDQFYYFA